jgi:hypothetical protein
VALSIPVASTRFRILESVETFSIPLRPGLQQRGKHNEIHTFRLSELFNSPVRIQEVIDAE